MMTTHAWKIGGVIMALALALGAAHFFLFIRQDNGHSIVYLSNGEMYIGRLSTFPRLTLSDAYLLQAVPDRADPQKSTFQLMPLEEGLWAPKYLYINQDQVLFSGPLSETSSIFKTLQGSANNPTSADSIPDAPAR